MALLLERPGFYPWSGNHLAWHNAAKIPKKNSTRFSTNSKGREKERIPKSFEFGLVIFKI